MRMLVIGGNFRNSCRYLDRYDRQFTELSQAMTRRGVATWGVFAEGDHSDDTRAELYRRFGMRACIVPREHGGPDLGSVDTPQRWKMSGWVSNGVMENMPHSMSDDDVFLWVESDLIWNTETMLALIDHTITYPCVAPMCWAGKNFYDTFGHRKDGVQFGPFPPYHEALKSVRPGELVQIDSAGSCFAMWGECARVARFSEVDSILGVGRTLYKHGYSFWLDPSLGVRHPA
jgi:hypothetical protein